MLNELEQKFHGAMLEIYRRAKSEAKYNASIFLNMLNDRGGLATAKYLINSTKVSEGYRELWQRKRLDLTVEAEVVQTEMWHPLFTNEELEKARKRLIEYRYDFKHK